VEYAAVESAPLVQIVQWVLETSDNEAAEVLFRHVALATGRPGSFEGGSAAVREVLGSLGVELAGARILDGSGLSRRNRLSPATLLDVLEVAASEEHPNLRRTVSGLPVAGFTGSLAYRFDVGADAGLGWVRAKTGTLTGVHGLAGIATDDSGVVFAFVAIADRVARPDTLDARAQLDAIAAALAGCRCAA
jgi:D-alanyl-D-alanine carboxypeptidase/D-alanyl-D-alanine-endopeptidase (penicillin-binding protein 4)